MSDRALDGIRAKLGRAREHFERLDREMNAYTDRHPYTVVPIPHENVKVRSFGVRVTEPIPMRWGILLGEAVHNLRSALDNAIYALTLDYLDERPQFMTGFPVYETANEFDRYHGADRIQGTGEAVKQFVMSLQVYNDRTTAGQNLLALSRFWNHDKHRVLEPWGIALRTGDHNITSTPPFSDIRLYYDTLHDENTEAFRIWFPADPGQVQVKGSVNVGLAVEDPTKPERSEESTMWSMCDSATAVTSALLSMLGRQDIPPFGVVLQ